MSLSELLLDLAKRMEYVEKEYYPKMARCDAKVEALEKRYNKKCGNRPNLALVGVIVGIAVLGLACFIADKMLGGEKPDTMTLTVVCVIAAAAVVLSIVLTVVIYAARERSAEAWWANTAKPQVLEQKKQYEEYEEKVSDILAQNHMVAQIPDYWFNSEDCFGLWEIAYRHQNASMMDVVFMYEDALESKRRHNEIVDTINSGVQEITDRQNKIIEGQKRAELQRDWTNLQLDSIRYDLNKFD